MKISKKIGIGVLVVVLLAAFLATAGYGAINYSGPLRYFSILRVQLQNPPAQHQGGIVFYGASNFRLWDRMEEDMTSYGYPEVVNNGFGGCSDQDLIRYAPQLLFPYHPSVVFIQTGSNDYALSGLDAEEVKKNKVEMYSYFAENLPDTKFIIMSGLPLPGRAEYWENIQTVNQVIEEYCNETENFYYVDSDPAMLNADGSFKPEFFRKDQIHLNQKGHDAWTVLMIDALHEIGYSQDAGADSQTKEG